MNVRQDFTLVLGWYLHEILASLEAASAILLDTGEHFSFNGI